MPITKQTDSPRVVAGLTWGENEKREPGKIHIEWHAPCGCAFHLTPFPHIHPCSNEHKRPDLHAPTEESERERVRTLPVAAPAPSEDGKAETHEFDAGPVDTGICQHRTGGKICSQRWDAPVHRAATAKLAEYQKEYERLFNWRAIWNQLSNSKRFTLAVQQERIEAKAARANWLIAKLITDYDSGGNGEPAPVSEAGAAAAAASAAKDGADLFPKTTYKNKRHLLPDERFKLNAALNQYLFDNCEHEHDGYPNHLACRWCALEVIAAIVATTPAAPSAGPEEPK